MADTSDVVIIGGGAAGCAVAYYLAKRGVKATIIEREGIASKLVLQSAAARDGTNRTLARGGAASPGGCDGAHPAPLLRLSSAAAVSSGYPAYLSGERL